MDKIDLYARDISGLTWRKCTKSFPDGQECVEVAEFGGGAIALRDSTNPTRPDLQFTASEWAGLRGRDSWRRVLTAERVNLDDGGRIVTRSLHRDVTGPPINKCVGCTLLAHDLTRHLRPLVASVR